MKQSEYEREGSDRPSQFAFSSLFKGAGAAATVLASALSVARYVESQLAAPPILRWLGLARRRSFVGTMALFGAGVVTGAGIAMFVSPRTGQEMRRGLSRGFRRVEDKGRELVHSAGVEIARRSESKPAEGQLSSGRSGSVTETSSRAGAAGGNART